MKLASHVVIFSIIFILFAFGAQAADTYAYVTQTSNASTISLLNSASGKQFAGRAPGITTRTGAVYSSSMALLIQTNEKNGSTNTIVVYNYVTGKVAGTITLPATITAIAATPTFGIFYAATSSGEAKPGTLYQCDYANFTFKNVFQSSVPLVAIAVSPDGGTIYASTYAALISIGTSNFQQTASVPITDIGRIVVSPDGKEVYLTLNDPAPVGPMVAEYAPSTQTVIGSTPSDANAYVAVSPDNSSFYTTITNQNGQTVLEQIGTKPFHILNSVTIGPVGNLTGAPPLAINPDGSSIAIVSQTNEPDVTLVTLPGLTIAAATPVGHVCGLAYLSVADIAVTNCGADTVDVVDITVRKLVARFDAGPSPVFTLPGLKGSVIYVSNQYGVWALQANNGKILSKVEIPGPFEFSNSAGQLALSANGQTLYAAYPLGVFEISTATNQLIGPVPGIPPNFAVSAIATSPNFNFLFVAGTPGNNLGDYELLVLDQVTGTLARTVEAPILGVDLVSSKDGSALYFEGTLGGVIPSLYKVEVLAGTFTMIPSQEYGNLALSPDGKTLYVAGSAIEAIDTTDSTYTGIPSPVPASGIAITPDDLNLVVTSQTSQMGVITIANPILGATIPIGGGTSGISLR